MALSAKFIRRQLALFKPFVMSASVGITRKGQDKIGDLMKAVYHSGVAFREIALEHCPAAFAVPREPEREGVVLYLHGGGYMAGDLEYAKGFATTLAHKNHIRVFCPAYRLAPEHPFPAALEDALAAYRYLLENGYTSRQIVLCGESAGGGLIYALCLKLKEQEIELPAGLIAISPWSDLTASGASYQHNRARDPSMTAERLSYYARLYVPENSPCALDNPFVSPLFGDLTGMPPSLIFVGGDEIMLDDAVGLHSRLIGQGCTSELTVAEGMWHGYILYCVKETKKDFEKIHAFLKEFLR